MNRFLWLVILVFLMSRKTFIAFWCLRSGSGPIGRPVIFDVVSDLVLKWAGTHSSKSLDMGTV